MRSKKHLRVRDEGIVTKCGEKTGEKLIPRLGEILSAKTIIEMGEE